MRRLLIANRGEIAIRIARTARRMGIAAIAVYSDADAESLHVSAADMAVRIGPAEPRQSYLNIEAILQAARLAKADAVHPGYGFLAENAGFARACGKEGLIFVGPPAAAIELMGDKGQARRLAEKAGVPVVPGYDGNDQDPRRLALEAKSIGCPVLLKPAAGGGGKGMRAVHSLDLLPDAVAAARREAEAAFGDGRLIVEKYIEAPRHVEVQVFADNEGGAVHLFERDCSIQRRHQKLIEEAPAPGLASDMRQNMRAAALALAKACKYAGAGTVEFLVKGSRYYFMEMNTRLQVEHTVTEAVTGLDLVEWQLRVAQGEKLPLSQEEIRVNGHAIEARLCAEDPQAEFLPQSGAISHFRMPKDRDEIRIDSGVGPGSPVPPHYDSLLAKIIAHGSTRKESAARLVAALAAAELAGLRTNRRFLARIVEHPAFAEGTFDTGFIADHGASVVAADEEADPITLALAAFAVQRRAEMDAARPRAGDPFSPWLLVNGWRLGHPAAIGLRLAEESIQHEITLTYRPHGYLIELAGKSFDLSGQLAKQGSIEAEVGDLRLRATAVFDGARLTLFAGGRDFRFDRADPCQAPAAAGPGTGHLRSPMPGTVIAVLAKAGEKVAKGASLVIVEAMKMEHTIAAPHGGIVAAVKVAKGDQVAAGAEVAVMESKP